MSHTEAPSKIISKPRITGEGLGFIEWECDEYYGSLREYARGFPIGDGPYKILGITAIDETARHDWREFQQLKNHLVGDEWEGIELYPAESRLVDPSNRFYLWCIPKDVIPWGLPGDFRRVNTDTRDGVPQRPYPNVG